MKYLNKSIKKNIIIAIIASILLLIYIRVEAVKFVINIVIISFIISYAIKPIRDLISEKLRISTKRASMAIILISIVIIFLIGYFIVPILIEQSKNFNDILYNLDKYVRELLNEIDIGDLALADKLYFEINDKMKIFTENISGKLLENREIIIGNLIGIGIVPVVTYYFLADGELIYNRFLLIFPTSKRVMIRKINKNIDKVLSRYIISQVLLSLIIGAMTFIMLLIIGVRFALVLALINAIVNIIPYFGPIIGAVPMILIALLDSPSKVLFVLIGSFLIQQIEGDLLAPKITGDSTKLHPVIIIILLIFGERIGGVFGMILAVPVVVIIKVIYEDINYYLF